MIIAIKTTRVTYEDGCERWRRSWWLCIGYRPLIPLWMRWYKEKPDDER